MAKKTLVDSMIESGRDLVRALDAMPLQINAALWWLNSESSDWLLVIGTPEVERGGPRHVYQMIERALRRLGPGHDLDLQDVAAVSDKAPEIALLRSAIDTGGGMAGIRFRNNVISGVPVEDAFIYRLTGGSAVGIGSSVVDVGGETTVDIVVRNIGSPGLGAWTIDVTYDSKIVAAVDCSTNYQGICNSAFRRDTVRVAGAFWDVNLKLVGSIVLASLTFRGVRRGVSDLTPRLEVLADATVGDPQDITARVTGGRITVTQPDE